MNSRWDTLVATHDAVKDLERRSVPEHTPTAAIITCSDARVPPSVIFDQPAGSLFVVRVAGNTAGPATLASIDYAVAELGVDLIIVLGHTGCGAVTAACAGQCDGYLAPLTAQICELANNGQDLSVDEVAVANVEATVDALAASQTPTGIAIRAGSVTVQGAIYDLATDELRPLDDELPISHQTPSIQKEPLT